MKMLAACIILACTCASGLTAQKAQAGFFLDQGIQAEYNPLGLQFVTRLFYRLPLVQSSGVLWESTRIDAGLINNLSPAYDMAGAFVTIEPIAIFNITLSAQAAGFYDAFGFGFYELSGYGAGFDNASRQGLSARNTGGYVLAAAPTLKAAVGPFAFLNTFSVTYFNVNGGNGYFYERVNNCVLGESDTELLNQLYLMCALQPGLLAGLNDWILYVPGSGYISHRVSALGLYSGKLTDTVSLYAALAVGTYLADRYYQDGLYTGGQVGIVMALK